MQKINTLIAEDDFFSRQLLKGMIENDLEFEVIGEAADGLELLELTKKLKPQLIFIDIDMPELSGMEAAKEITAWNPNVLIIFVTGHMDFALDAYEFSTMDYIVKPFDQERIDKALSKVKLRIQNVHKDLDNIARALKMFDKLFIKIEHELHFIDTESIILIERDKSRRKSIIFTNNNRYETYDSLSDLESKLNKTDFFRSHKSYIINLRKVKKIIPWGEGGSLVSFNDCAQEALISRNKIQLLYQLLKIS